MPLSIEGRRRAEARHSRKIRDEFQDIGPPPPVVDPERRAACERDLGLFQRTYLPDVFHLAPASFHVTATEKMQTAVLSGGQFAWAQPRGSGKTSQAEACVLWAILYGHRSFPLFVGASEGVANHRLSSIKIRLETSDLLFDDFPEVCHPIRSLNRTPRRAPTQKIDGQFTFIEWTAGQIVLPTVEGSEASGACLRVAGITSAIRGMSHTRADGTVIRPDLVIGDDVQTRESAKSATQTADRLAIISADMSYLAGPGIPIAMLLPCTVVYQDDLADQLLNREKYPEYRGERTKMVVQMPKYMKFWEEYNEILRDSLRNDGDHTPATEFYAEHQEEMDEGAVVSWPERKAPHQLSAIQHAMDLFFRDPVAFASEMQNEPIERQEVGEGACKPEEILDKTSHLARYEVPADASTIVAHIDVQKDCLYYVLMAVTEAFNGHVLDYGVWPPQKRRSMLLRDVRPTLREHYATTSVDAAIYAGLLALVEELNAKPLVAEGQKFVEETPAHQVGQILIDAAWGESTDNVKEVCRRLSKQCIAAFGKGIKATSNPMHLWAKQKGERIGPHWRRRRDRETKQPYVIFDSNYFKSFAHARFKTALGERGCFSLYSRAANRRPLDPGHHRHFANQFCAEFPKLVESGGRRVNEWFMKQAATDNHMLDCVIGCCVRASMSGIGIEGTKRRQIAQAQRTTMEAFFGPKQRQ